MEPRKILVTGATGYVGGRLVPRLIQQGHRVRCLVRQKERLRGRSWEQNVGVVLGDVLQYDTLVPALEGIDAAYYLIHSLAADGAAATAFDNQAAQNFGRAAATAGVARIVYLGCLHSDEKNITPRLKSRLETGEHLRSGGVPVTEFRSGAIVGSGSLSFELIRYLTEREPVMICPAWARTPVQPIAIRTVLHYLLEALERPESAGRVFEIGGVSVLSYLDMFRIYARIRGLKRYIFCLPVLPFHAGLWWTSMVTPFSMRIVRSFIEALEHETIVRDNTARSVFDVQPLAIEDALLLALRRFATDDVDSTWHDAVSSALPSGEVVETLTKTKGIMTEQVELSVRASPSAVFRVVTMLGGDVGWLHGHLLWRLRGFLDHVFGGVGLRRGRRSSTSVRVGDALDVWRVEAVEKDILLRLRAEMKMPGKAWLQFDITAIDEGGSRIRQTAFFEPKGILGLLYWYSLYPFHCWLFPGMIRALGRRAESLEAASHSSTVPDR